MGECYVCLEETDEESPCKCSAPLHKACFDEMQMHRRRSTCSICKQPYPLDDRLEWREVRNLALACLFIIFILTFSIAVWLWY